MSRSTPASRLLLVALAVTGLTLAGATPAFAEYSSPGTATIEVTSVTEIEGEIEGFCPEGTVGVTVTTTTPGITVLSGLVWYGDDPSPADEGRFTVGFLSDSASPGSSASFTVACADVTETVIGTASTTAVIYDSGASISAPASVVVGEAIPVTGVCPASTALADVLALVESTSATAGIGTQPQVAGAWSRTFAATDFAPAPVAGDRVEVSVYCSSTVSVVSYRSIFVDIVAAPAGPGPAAPGPAAPGDELAETGPADGGAVGLLAAGLALLALGGGALFLLRRFAQLA